MTTYPERFTRALARHLEFEGGYSVDPRDPGGETYRGISRRFNHGWLGWRIIDLAKAQPGFPESLGAKAELDGLLTHYYYDRYWKPMLLDLVEAPGVAEELFDIGAGPNGVAAAARIAQASLALLGVEVQFDGRMGPRTVKALNEYRHPESLVKLLNCLQFVAFLFGGARMADLLEMTRSRKDLLRVFLRGWLRRVDL